MTHKYHFNMQGGQKLLGEYLNQEHVDVAYLSNKLPKGKIFRKNIYSQ